MPGGPTVTRMLETDFVRAQFPAFEMPALRAMAIDPDTGVLRLSFVHCITKEEIDKLLNALDDIL